MTVHPSQNDTPARIADGFHAMNRVLPPSYHLVRPPAEGVELVVIGRDGIATRWRMSVQQANGVMPLAREMGCRVVPQRYSEVAA